MIFYRPPPPQPPRRAPTKTPLPLVTRRNGLFVIGGLAAGAVSYYGFRLYSSVSRAQQLVPQDFDTSYRFDATATTFDDETDLVELTTGIGRMRKQLVRRAHGKVLEVAVGTNRNGGCYDLDKIESLTLLDQSEVMMEKAQAKWRESHPDYEQCRFVTQSALAPIPPAPASKPQDDDHGYDTILSTMSLCSTPEPSLLLRNLATSLSPTSTSRTPPSTSSTALSWLGSSEPKPYPPPRILLLEHGRSHYAWLDHILDRTASEHALKHGCWWNRDIGQIVEDSGLEIINMRRRLLGTMWLVELRLPDRARGKERAQWLVENEKAMEANRERVRKKKAWEIERLAKLAEQERLLQEWKEQQLQDIKEGKKYQPGDPIPDYE